MKKKFLGTLMFLCLSVLSVFADNAVNKSIVPEDYLKVMNRADSVTCILIDPWVEDAKDWMDGYGEMLTSKCVKNKQLIKETYNLFSDSKSFVASDVVKNCVHMPDFVMIFHSKKGDVKVSYSFYCDVCRFAKGEKYTELDGEIIRNNLLNLLSKYYPKDRYIRYLIKKSKSNF